MNQQQYSDVFAEAAVTAFGKLNELQREEIESAVSSRTRNHISELASRDEKVEGLRAKVGELMTRAEVAQAEKNVREQEFTKAKAALRAEVEQAVQKGAEANSKLLAEKLELQNRVVALQKQLDVATQVNSAIADLNAAVKALKPAKPV